MSEKKRSNGAFVEQGIILAVAGIITKIIGLAYRIPLTNIMGDKGQGYYSFAFSIYSMALLLSSYSLPLAVSKLVSVRLIQGKRSDVFRVVKCALIFSGISGGVTAAVIYFGSDFIATEIMGAPLCIYALRILAPGLLIVAVVGVLRGYFQGMGTMVPTAISQIIEQIINAVVSIIGAYILYDIGSDIGKNAGNVLLAPAYSAAGSTCGTVVGAASALFFLIFVFYIQKKHARQDLEENLEKKNEDYVQILKLLLITIIPVILSTAVYNINETLDLIIFSKIMTTQGVAESHITTLRGMFSGKYNTLIHVPLAIADSLGASIVPGLSGAFVLKNKKLIQNKINMTTRVTMIIAFPCAVGLFVLAEPIMKLLYNGDTATPASMLRVGVITVVFYSLSTVMNAMLQGINRMIVPVKNAIVSLIIHLIAVVIMLVIFKNNIYALIIGNIVFSFTMCVLNGHALSRYINYRKSFRKMFIIPGLASLLMGGAAFIIYSSINLLLGNSISTIVTIVFAAGGYFAIFLILGGVSEKELRSLPKGKLLFRIGRKLHLI